jgi:hypothetical protein
VKLSNQKTIHWMKSPVIACITLAIACCGVRAVAQAQAADEKTGPQIYQTLYLTNLTQQNDANEIISDLRNMLPNVKLYYVPSQSAISIRSTAEEIALAQKILSDLDKTKKIYRLTYTMTERDSGKTIGVQHYSIVVASGSKTDFKQGSRVPVSIAGSNAPSENVTYLDVGQEIEASLDGYFDGVRLRTRVVQSSIAEDKSLVGPQDPVIRQTSLEGTSTLVQGKPLVLGSLDVPGTTRHQEVEVVSELVR